MATKVYRYGLLAPTENAGLVHEQMVLAHRYRNRLVEIERERRAKLRELDTCATQILSERVTVAKEALDDLVARVAREKARRRQVPGDDLRAQVKALRLELREMRRKLAEQRREVRLRPGHEEARDAINEEFLRSRRSARAECGVYWGTYQLAEEAAEKQRADLPLWDGEEPNDPRFLRWEHEGQVSVQIVGGLAVEDLENGGSSQVVMTEQWHRCAHDRRDPNSKRSQKVRRLTLHLRVGSDDERKPVWAELPIGLHRPLPPGARIKRVTVQRRRIGPRDEWSALFVLDLPPAVPTSLEPVVAIDIGWRQSGGRGRLRLACLADESGTDVEWRMPDRIATGLQKPEDLRSTRDQNLTDIRDWLAAWKAGADVPEWFAEKSETLSQWRSCARLAALCIEWRGRRFAGDRQAYDRCEAWRLQDRHLWSWERSQYVGAQRARRDHFRCLAADLARRYGTVVLEEFDLRTFARLPLPEEGDSGKAQRSNRFMAGLAELRLIIRNAFATAGGTVATVDPANTTRQCHECGAIETWDAAARLRHTCVNGHEWDQDQNAARNILARWRSECGPGAARHPHAIGESRREKQRRMRAEKVDRMRRSKDDGETPFAAGVG